MATSGSLLADVPERLEAERFDQSTGQATPPGEWFDQAWDEWVVVITGAAEILLEDEDAPRSLGAGD